MNAQSLSSSYSRGEELANSITHGLGVLLAITGLVQLVLVAAWNGTARHIVSSALYGSTLVLLYLASTLYHAVQQPEAKRILRIFDHSAILLLIAGTYTPFTLISLQGPWGWSLFGTIWGLALLGIILEITSLRRLRFLLIALYLTMGWAVVVAVKPMLTHVPPAGLWLLLAGGLCYTGGLGFYLWKRLPYHHAIWHLFVLAGSILHYIAIFYDVLPHPPAT
ncbi:MAG: hemolysin III family protein [Desulfobulbus sp.]